MVDEIFLSKTHKRPLVEKNAPSRGRFNRWTSIFLIRNIQFYLNRFNLKKRSLVDECKKAPSCGHYLYNVQIHASSPSNWVFCLLLLPNNISHKLLFLQLLFKFVVFLISSVNLPLWHSFFTDFYILTTNWVFDEIPISVDKLF